ncbi:MULTISPECIES: glycosyltransferase family 2 protein [unclassified Sphingomonas]|uniref:glycosyltransferase family 2 protein n=1 Tax=unclassified Sphingomonas TaxID=196159 RepID=UPI0006FFCC81|nr:MULTISPECIES: glycosyltransferase family 2 protein [unclassified Sphingomonas]KQX26170.1 family 2 glycosyl transferase [Sphingomonas sp. Root1294]KQY69238.1 family 2 glycosyl transferase [Sphingomonas sp. Root50]KRB89492.1 family 2 glycosyl transferase [Sphingomonas sp. Root720]
MAESRIDSTKISIITAVYNRAETLGDAIKSLQNQTYPAVEHIIQDGGSTDGTLDLIGCLMNKSIILKSQKDDGIYDAINRGIARSTGGIIGLMHSDDFYASPLVLEKVAAAFLDPLVDGVYGDLQYVSSTDPQRSIRYWRSGRCTMRNIAFGWMPPHPTLFLRREIFDRWGSYDAELRIAADYDAMLRWIVKGRIRLIYIPQVLIKMRVGGESNRSLKQIVRKSREDYVAIKRNGVGGMVTLLAKNLRKIPQFVRPDGRPVP